MPSLKGLACVSLLTLAIVAPSAFAQSGDTAPSPPTVSPANPSAAPANGLSGKGARKHRHHRRKASSSPQSQGQPSAASSDPH